jgi:hypothetical protein
MVTGIAPVSENALYNAKFALLYMHRKHLFTTFRMLLVACSEGYEQQSLRNIPCVCYNAATYYYALETVPIQ